MPNELTIQQDLRKGCTRIFYTDGGVETELFHSHDPIEVVFVKVSDIPSPFPTKDIPNQTGT